MGGQWRCQQYFAVIDLRNIRRRHVLIWIYWETFINWNTCMQRSSLIWWVIIANETVHLCKHISLWILYSAEYRWHLYKDVCGPCQRLNWNWVKLRETKGWDSGSVRCNKKQTWETLEEVAVTVTGKIWQISHSHNFAPGWRRGGAGRREG